jgi:membrane associated rhomboid family serine protease
MESLLAHLKETPVAFFIFCITIVTSALALGPQPQLIDTFIFNPVRILKGRQYHRLISHMLIHGSWMHLIVNMISFYYFAFLFEQYLQILFATKGLATYWGSVSFAVIYVLSGIGGSIPALIKHRNNYGYNALGASGAIAGVLFGAVLFLVHQKGAMILLFFIIPIPTWLFPILYLVYSYWAGRYSEDNVAHDAHFMGAITGLVLTLILAPEMGTLFVSTVLQKIGL